MRQLILGTGDFTFHRGHPAPGGISETEILPTHGGVHFGSKLGPLAGNHFVTLASGQDDLPAHGKTVWVRKALPRGR